MAESKADRVARQRDEYIAGLEAELVGYERYGNKARAKDVRAELKRVREQGEQEVAAAAERAAAAESGETITPTDASPFGEMSLRDLKEAAAARGLTVNSRTRQDFIDALDKAEAEPATTDDTDDGGASDDESDGKSEDGAGDGASE
ncbi:hypothetical protein [Agromyces sp. SYSU T00194]|uniref:hypothetical protein n=1 Tax=Agromyces chitinivorans TaxID=3158560 RepID=UPI00339A70F7